MTALARVRDRIEADGDPLLVEVLADQPSDFEAAAVTVGQSDLAAGLEAIREGHLLHGSEPRLIDSEDGDLKLLAGDRLYALGLELVAGTGDSDAIRRLSDLIKACAEARAEGSEAAAEQAWEEVCAQIGKQAC